MLQLLRWQLPAMTEHVSLIFLFPTLILFPNDKLRQKPHLLSKACISGFSNWVFKLCAFLIINCCCLNKRGFYFLKIYNCSMKFSRWRLILFGYSTRTFNRNIQILIFLLIQSLKLKNDGQKKGAFLLHFFHMFFKDWN